MAIRKPIFVVPLDLVDMVCSTTQAGHPLSNLAQFPASGLTWKSEVGATHWLRGQFDGASPVNFLSILSANAVAGTQYRLRLGTSQAEVDGTAPYDSGVLTFISPSITRDDGLYHSHLEMGSIATATWWRIDISGHTGAFEAAAVVMGKKVEPSRFYNRDFAYGIEDQGDANWTAWGVLDEKPGIIMRTLEFTLGWIAEAEFEASFRPMIERLGVRGMVLCCFDPEPGPYRQAKTYFGLMKKPGYATGIRKAGYYTQDFSLISII